MKFDFLKRAIFLLALLTLLLGCGPGGVSKETTDKARKAYESTVQENGGICLYQGPFPWRRSDHVLGCEMCDRMAIAGLLKSGTDDRGQFYALTEDGKALYQNDIDYDYKTAVKARFAAMGKEVPDNMSFERPRLCFAQARFHSVAAVLPPMPIGGQVFQSFKIVRELTEVNELIYKPEYAPFTKGCNKRPEPGKPTLCEPRIYTFGSLPDGSFDWRNDITYGAWVNEREE